MELVLTSRFSIKSTTAYWIERIEKTVLKIQLRRCFRARRNEFENMNLRNTNRLFELRIDESNLFHFITEDGMKVFLKRLCLKG